MFLLKKKYLKYLNYIYKLYINMEKHCTDKLTDLEYLKHMIPNVPIAIDMSNLLIPESNNPRIQSFVEI